MKANADAYADALRLAQRVAAQPTSDGMDPPSSGDMLALAEAFLRCHATMTEALADGILSERVLDLAKENADLKAQLLARDNALARNKQIWDALEGWAVELESNRGRPGNVGAFIADELRRRIKQAEHNSQLLWVESGFKVWHCWDESGDGRRPICGYAISKGGVAGPQPDPPSSAECCKRCVELRCLHAPR